MGFSPSARKHHLFCFRLHKYLWMHIKISDVKYSAKKGTDESPSCPHLVVIRWPASHLQRPSVILSFSVSSWKSKWIRGESVWQQWGLCCRSACRDLPSPSVTAAAHLGNYSYLGPGRGQGPWLLRIRKSREIVQGVSGRAEMITHGLFTWTPVLFVLNSSLSWWAALGANTGHFISTLQGCQIHDTAPRHQAGLYIKVSSYSQPCALISGCASSQGSVLAQRRAQRSDLWDVQKVLDPPLGQDGLGGREVSWTICPWAKGHLGALEGGCGQPQGHSQAGDSWWLSTGTELLRFFFSSLRDGHFMFTPLRDGKGALNYICFQKLNAALPEINYSLALQTETIHAN